MNWMRIGDHVINLDRIRFIREARNTDGQLTGSVLIVFAKDDHLTLSRDEVAALLARLNVGENPAP